MTNEEQRVAKIIDTAKARVDASGHAVVWISALTGAAIVADKIWAELTRKTAPLRHEWRVERWPDGFGTQEVSDDGSAIEDYSDISTLALRVRDLHIPTVTEQRSISASEAHRDIIRAIGRIVRGNGIAVVSSPVGCTPRVQVMVDGKPEVALYRLLMRDTAPAALACTVSAHWTPEQIDAFTQATIGGAYVDL